MLRPKGRPKFGKITVGRPAPLLVRHNKMLASSESSTTRTRSAIARAPIATASPNSSRLLKKRDFEVVLLTFEVMAASWQGHHPPQIGILARPSPTEGQICQQQPSSSQDAEEWTRETKRRIDRGEPSIGSREARTFGDLVRLHR
jgi:hypothetical protein